MLPSIQALLVLQDRDRRLRSLAEDLAKIPKDETRAKDRLAGDTAAVAKAKEALQANEIEIKKVELDVGTRKTTIVRLKTQQFETRKNDEFTALAAKHANLTYVPALSNEPEGSDWTGFRGFVHDAAKAHFRNDFRGHKAYLCGPPKMIDACITTLMQGQLFERDIYTEKFLSAADAQQSRSPLFKSI